MSPYRSGLATGVGTVLLAGLGLGVADIVHAGGAALPILGLWAILALPVAIGTGLVLGAGNATWGDGWIRRGFARLRDEPEVDRTVAAILIAAAVLGGVLALGVGKLAIGLVANVQRKNVGALLLGVVVVGVVPILALAALPVFRLTRRIAALIPAIGPLSRVVLLVVAATGAGVAAGLWIVFRKLDYQALDLGFLAAALLPVVALAIALVAYGLARGLRERIPARGVIVGLGALVAAVLPVVGLGGTPSEDVKNRVIERSYLGGRMIAALRKLSDHDHDGYSALFGGPDCDDHNPNIHPGAVDIPDNGIDENCDGFDAHAQVPSQGPGPTIATTLTGGDNALVIFVDTLRFDRLGATLMPRLDAFAKQAVVFRHAYANAPRTPRSVPSFLASRYPTQLAVDDPNKSYGKVLDDNDLLFEALKTKLWTVGESSHFYFCDDTCSKDVLNTDFKPMRSNITQGADEWDNADAKSIPESNHDIAGPRIVAKTRQKLRDLAASKKKFAMIVHLFEPHSTYMEHPGVSYKSHSFEEKYDGEVAFEDGMIGQILDELDATGLAKTTTVVVMSDHGEAFASWHGSEAGHYHGMSLYQELLHVPLMFRVPGAKPCTRDDVVQLVDLAPTLAALFGVTPPSTWVGRSLVPALECKSLPPQPAYAEMVPDLEWNHQEKSMVTPDAKRHVYQRIAPDAKWEIYDLDADPDERTNLAGSDPKAKELEQALAGWTP